MAHKAARPRQTIRDSAEDLRQRLSGFYDCRHVEQWTRSRQTQGHRVVVGFLDRPTAAMGGGGAGRHKNDLCALAARREHSSQGIRQPRSRRGENNHWGVGYKVCLDRCEGRACFMSEMRDFHVALRERSPKRRDCAAGHAESVAYTEIRQGFDDRLADRLRWATQLAPDLLHRDYAHSVPTRHLIDRPDRLYQFEAD